MTLVHTLHQAVTENTDRSIVGYHAQDTEAARNGWRESRAPACVLAVAGHRGPDHGNGCPCPQWFDHTRLWLTQDGAYVLTVEPYGVKGSDLAALVDVLEPLGLDVFIDGYSPWGPLSTLRLSIVTKKETA